MGWLTQMFVLAVAVALVGQTLAKDDTPGKSLIKMKTGTCVFKLLDSNGVKPLADQMLILASVKDGKALTTVSSSKEGICSLDIATGRYILSVNKMDLAVLEASESATLSECRIVVPEKGMLVGGQEAKKEESKDSKRRMGWLAGGCSGATPFIIGGAVVLAGGAGYLIYDNNKDEAPTAVAPATAPTPSR
jgi:hypothetical protein